MTTSLGETSDLYLNWTELNEAFEPRKETFIMCTEVVFDVVNRGSQIRLLLTDKSIYRLMPDGTRLHERIPLSSVHIVCEDETQPCSFLIVKRKMGSIETIGTLALGKTVNANALMEIHHFQMTNELEQDLFITSVNALIRDMWQFEAENSRVMAPEVFQYHTPVIKLNRKNKQQDRVIVLSNQWLYNMEAQWGSTPLLTRKSLRWAIPIEAIRLVRLVRKSRELLTGPAISIYLDMTKVKTLLADDTTHMGSKGKTINDYHTFCFRSEWERHLFLCEISRLFLENKGRESGQRLVVDSSEDNTGAGDGAGSQPEGEQEVAMEGFLLKYTGGGKGKHKKYVIAFNNGMIEWRDQMAGKGKKARIVIVSAGVGDLPKKKDFTDEEKVRLFTIQTDSKTLQLLADSEEIRNKWLEALNTHRSTK